MPATEIVRARIDPELKKEASPVLADIGLSVSEASRLLLVRVAPERALPFDVRVPNDKTEAALRDAHDGKVDRFESVADMMAQLSKQED